MNDEANKRSKAQQRSKAKQRPGNREGGGEGGWQGRAGQTKGKERIGKERRNGRAGTQGLRALWLFDRAHKTSNSQRLDFDNKKIILSPILTVSR